MSKKREIKGPKDNNIVKEPDGTLNYPVLCFKYLTKNKKYTIQYFKKSADKQKAYGALFHLINDMQNTTWNELFLRSKGRGLETIEMSELKFKPQLTLTPDTKVLVIRFRRQKYRMVGIKSDINKDVFHVFGFDFNYSAYDHGK